MRSLDPCSGCLTGTMVAYKTRRCKNGKWAVRYLRCDAGCGQHGQQIVEAGPPRARRERKLYQVGTEGGENGLQAFDLPVTAAAGGG